MSLVDQISALATRLATEFNSVRTALVGKAADSAVVHNTGTETIAGAKTFSTAPVVPVGTLATHPVRRDDTRLTDARTPTTHASTHASGGGDPVTPAAIGAATSGHTHAAPAVIALPEQGSVPSATADAESLFAVDVNGITSVRLVSPTGLVTDVQRDNSIIVRNETGSTIAKGAPVYIAGVSASAYGQPATYLPLVALARANSTTTMPAIGLAIQAISSGTAGRVLRYGMLTGVDTSAYAVGQRLWVATSAAGTLTNVEPVDRVQRVGIVARAHATEGQILVDPRAMLAISEGSLTPSGGATNTVLAKSSATNWDTGWKALTASDVGADPAGTASSAVAAHVAAGDPHPQYLTQAEADALYRALNPAPRTQSVSGTTANIDVGAAGDLQVTLTNSPTLTPTSGVNGRVCVVECLASGAQRVATLAASVVLTTGLTSRALTIPSGQRGVFVIRYTTLGTPEYALVGAYLAV